VLKNPNTNCLAGLACPKCGSFGPFSIDCQAYFDVHDDGTDNARDVRWDKNSTTVCQTCDFTAKNVMFDFYQLTKKHRGEK
jgi:hypothetical protein